MHQLINAAMSVDHDIICGVICMGYLLVLTVQDMQRRAVSTKLLLLGIGTAILYQILRDGQSVFLCIAGAVVGMIFIGVSKVTREGLGYGDSILIFALGIYLGLWELLYLIIIAFTLSAIFSMIILCTNQYQKKTVIPFIPFLAVSFLILFLGKIILRG